MGTCAQNSCCAVTLPCTSRYGKRWVGIPLGSYQIVSVITRQKYVLADLRAYTSNKCRDSASGYTTPLEINFQS